MSAPLPFGTWSTLPLSGVTRSVWGGRFVASRWDTLPFWPGWGSSGRVRRLAIAPSVACLASDRKLRRSALGFARLEIPLLSITRTSARADDRTRPPRDEGREMGPPCPLPCAKYPPAEQASLNPTICVSGSLASPGCGRARFVVARPRLGNCLSAQEWIHLTRRSSVGVEHHQAPKGPRGGHARPADAEREVAWSGCTSDWESFRSIDDAPGGRGHCQASRSRRLRE